MRVFSQPSDIHAAKGESLGVSEWLTITQDRINEFASATGDHQWIHVDVELAKQGPFGGTIAHGFLTLSLIPALTAEIYQFEGVKMGINYGLNKVRFPHPVAVGSSVRARTELSDVTDVSGGVQITFTTTIEIDGADKPACVAEHLVRLIF